MRLPPFPTLLILAALGGPLSGCGSRDVATETEAGATIPRETFVQAYVQLRLAALRVPEQQVPAPARQRILGELGITEEDLITFAELRGSDMEYMREVWAEVDSILRAYRDQPGGGGERGSSP